MRPLNYDIEDDSDYLFACAELKAREIEFVDKSRIDRMLKSQGLDEFFRVLRDTVYSRYVNELENSRSFEGIIVSEYGNAVEFLSKRLKDGHQTAAELLFFEENLHNIKTVIKSIILDADLKELFIPIFYSYESLKNAAAAGNYKDLSQPFSGTLEFAVGIMNKQKNHRILEFEMEKFYLEEIFRSTEKLNSKMISDYLRCVIDILNIKSIYRSKHLEEGLDFGYFLHRNGFFPIEFMIKFKDESIDFFVKKMEQTDYADMVIKGDHTLYTEGTFSFFEREEDLFYIDFFEPVKYTVSNLEKIFQFFLRKKLELKYLNIIFTAILYDIDMGKIKNRIEV